MALERFRYMADEKGEQKRWGIDAESLLQEMGFAEEFSGAYSERRIAENWFALKQMLISILTEPVEEEVKEDAGKEKA